MPGPSRRRRFHVSAAAPSIVTALLLQQGTCGGGNRRRWRIGPFQTDGRGDDIIRRGAGRSFFVPKEHLIDENTHPHPDLDAFTSADLRGQVEDAGVRDAEAHRLPAPQTLLIARK